MILRSLVIDAEQVCPTEYAEFMESLEALIRAGAIAIRNPPTTRNHS